MAHFEVELKKANSEKNPVKNSFECLFGKAYQTNMKKHFLNKTEKEMRKENLNYQDVNKQFGGYTLCSRKV